MIINIFKKSFTDVFNNIAPALILVIFLIVFNFISAYAIYATNGLTRLITLCLLLIVAGFLAGWFQVFKEIAKNNVKKEDENDVVESNSNNKKNLFGAFFEGVGKNTVTVSLGGIFYFGFLLLIFLIMGKIAFQLFGSLNFLSEDTIPTLQNAQAYSEYFKNLPDAQKVALSGWLSLNLLAIMIVNFVFMFYAPCLISDKTVVKDKYLEILIRPFVAFYESIKIIFKNFLEVIFLCIPIVILYSLLEILGAFLSEIQFLALLLLFIRIYFLSYIVMIVFNYYEAKNKQKIDSDNGSDCVGENEPCNRISEEN